MKMRGFVFLLCWAMSVQAETFKITTEEYAPYIVVESGRVSGVVVDILDAALKKNGHEVTYEVVPWARAIAMAENLDVVATAPWFKTVEREAVFLFSDPVITAVNKVFIRQAGRIPVNLEWRTYADFKPYTVGGVIGYWYTEGFNRAAVPLDLVAKDDQNVRKLGTGRIDAFITDEMAGWSLIRKILPGREGEFATLERPDSQIPLYVMASKKSAVSARFVENVNDGLRKLRASGEYESIVAKHKGR